VPYKSKKQAAFVHARAAAGEKWAQKFVRDSHGTRVRKKKRKRGDLREIVKAR